MRIVRVTREEFETADGSVFPIVPNLDEEMTIEEFQKHYDNAAEIVRSSKTLGGDDPDD